ncbi:UNVERIFIED_CONTAM: hypothetical protein K2H54_037571, partial [Gekko kuhli]
QALLIDLLVSKGAVVNATDYHGSTPLHLACQKGYQNVTLLLLHYKASTDIQDNNGNTALHLACTYGHEDCVKALVYYDVHSCKLDIGNEKGDTPLHIAARWGYQGIIEVLLQNGASPDIQNRMKETAVQCALNSTILSLMELNYLRFERRQSASQSLTRSEDTASQVSSGSSLSSSATAPIARRDGTKAYYKEVEKLLRAVADGDLEMVRYLLEWVEDDLEESEEGGRVEKQEFCHPLCQCSRCGPVQKELFRVPTNGLGVNAANHDGLTPLHVAALHGRVDLVSLLLKHGAEIGARNSNRAAPLHLACQNGHFQVVKCLMEFDAKQNKKDIHGNTPLIYACLNGDQEIADFLLQHGASVNLSNNEGNTALHKAVMGSHEALVRLLLQYQASTHIRNNRQRTPLDYAEQNSGIFKLLQAVSVSEEGSQADCDTHTALKIQKKGSHEPAEIADTLVARRLQLVQSISQFNKSQYLRKTITRDKSVPNFDDKLKHQLAIKSFDKSKLKPVDLLKQSRAEILDAGSQNKPAREEDDPDAAATPPLRSKLMQRRHTVNVDLSATDVDSISDVPTSREPSVSSLEGCSNDEELTSRQ